VRDKEGIANEMKMAAEERPNNESWDHRKEFMDYITAH
jgi:hypothetical protein